MALSELNKRVAGVLTDAFRVPLWVVAEVANVRSNPAGYTYLELVEKRPGRAQPLAKATGKFWTPSAPLLVRFHRDTGSALVTGMSILFRARVAFHTAYGLSLDVTEIDPTYSVGEMARRRAAVLARLTEEGRTRRNASLPFPPVAQRVAVVSSPKAAGLQDFLFRLARNPYGFGFCPTLFPATVQGEGAGASIRSALARIAARAVEFDAVVLIRGGGSAVDLSCFDDYDLARAVADCPLPVVAGIGHLRDRSVCDAVAARSVPTPTAAADLLVTAAKQMDDELARFATRLDGGARSLVWTQGEVLERTARGFAAAARGRAGAEERRLDGAARRTFTAARAAVEARWAGLEEAAGRLRVRAPLLLERHRADLAAAERDLRVGAARATERAGNGLLRLENDVRRMDPAAVLRRGFSITRLAGRAVRDARDVRPGDRVETVLASGRLESMVEAADPDLEPGPDRGERRVTVQT